MTRIFRGLSGLCENGRYVARVGEIRDARIRGRLRRIFRKSRDSQAILGNCHMSPARWVCAIYLDFSGDVGIQRKRDLLGAAGRNTGPPRIRGRLRRIFRISPESPVDLRNC